MLVCISECRNRTNRENLEFESFGPFRLIIGASWRSVSGADYFELVSVLSLRMESY